LVSPLLFSRFGLSFSLEFAPRPFCKNKSVHILRGKMKSKLNALFLAVLTIGMNFGLEAQVITTMAGDHSLGGTYSGDGGPATSAGLNGPSGISYSGGNLVFADTFNSAIRLVSSLGYIYSPQGAYVNFLTPLGAALDGNGYIYVADGDYGVIREFQGGNDPLYLDHNMYLGCALDGFGNVYGIDGYANVVNQMHCVIPWGGSPDGIVTRVAGNGTAGFSGDGGLAVDAQLNVDASYFQSGHLIISTLTVDNQGNVYIADIGNNVIRKVDTSGVINTVAGNHDLGGGFSGDGGLAINAQLLHPGGVAVDAQGNLYISDSGNHRVRRVDAATGIITTFAGTGTAGYSGDNGPPASAALDTPTGLTFDTFGNLYISDTANNVIRKVTYDSDGDGLLDSWEIKYFGNLNQGANGDYDGDGATNLQEFQAGTDPNEITFFPRFASYYVNSTTVQGTIELEGGVPYQIAVLVNSDNFASATWQPYSGPSFSFSVGPSDGVYAVWVGLRGRSADSAQSWESADTITLDRVAPEVTITNPTASTTSRPIIQLLGYSPEKLKSISFDLNNAAGFLANQDGNVIDQYIDPVTAQFTTNWFECLDIPLVTGLNTITLHTTDMAGNVSTHVYNYTLDFSSDTTAPVLTLEWPHNGDQICGNNFTLRGKLDDPTATVSAQITDSVGTVSTATGIVERNGLLWVEDLPLGTGANTLTLTMQDAAGNTSVSTITVNKSAIDLTIDPVSEDQLNQLTATITGKINVNDRTVWVNGVSATLTEDGQGGWNWQADDVDMGTAGTAVVQATAIPNSENGGNGSGGAGSGNTGAPGNPSSPNAASAAQTPERPYLVYVQKYTLDYKYHLQWSDLFCYDCYFAGDDHWWSKVDWTSAYTLGPSGGSSGTYENGYHYDAWWPDGTQETSCGETVLTCPKDIYVMPNIGPTRAGPTTSTSCSGPPSSGTGGLWAFPWEVWDYHWKDAYVDPDDGSSWLRDSDRTARMTMKLRTGGKSGSTRQNIFALSASANNYKHVNTHSGQWETEAVPPTSIQVCGKNLYADGIVYKKLADNDDVDITPVAPPKRYTYLVNAVKYRMIPRVECPAAGDPNLERTSLGVGERDLISGMPAETHWSTSAGTLSTAGPSSATTLTAPGTHTSITVTATVRSESCTINFDVVEPTGVQVNLRSQDSYTPPYVGAGLYLDVFLTPKTVSFYRVQIMEPAAAATGRTGYFVNNPPPNHDAAHGADDWHPVNCDNKVVEGVFDHAYSSGWPLGATGSYTWPISPIWSIDGTGPTHALNGWTAQVHTMTSGTMRVDKLGHSVTRAQNQTTGTAH
jgi:hypothetical protein